MFCKNCGAEINENDQFCGQCGFQNADADNVATSGKTSNKKKSVMIIALLVVLATIITLICFNANSVNFSPENVAVAAIKSEYEIDIKTMMKCFPEFTIKEIAVEEGLSPNASKSEIINKVKKAYRYETPLNVTIISTNVVAEYDIGEYTIHRGIYNYMSDEEYNSIKKIAKVNVEYVVNGKKESIQVTCIKIKSKWYFLRGF